MNYFDFHIHPTLKTTLKENLEYDSQVPTNAVSGLPGLCTDFPQIVASQASVKQLMRFDQKLLGVALHSIEKVIAGAEILHEIARKNRKLKKYISVQRLKDIESNDLKAYNYLKELLLPVFQTKPEFQIVESSTDFNTLDPNKIHVFFVLEGCHSLCNDSNTFFDKREIIANLNELTSMVPVLSVNLTHLQKSNICNQAFGIQLTNNSVFIPTGNGLLPDAEDVIQACFNKNICIDLKHMSLIARKNLFQQLNSNKYQNQQPVICTHTGFTGIPSASIPDYVLAFENKDGAVKIVLGKPNHVEPNVNHLQRPVPTFNASSINLYDEEIVAIVRNDGLIGLSMDRRISGFVSQFDEDPYAFFHDETFLVDKEYISVPEFQQLGINPNNISSKINDAWCNTKQDLLDVSDLPSALEEFHRQQIMLQLKHFLQVCINDGIPLAEAQTKICIGSDFDGIINPFYCLMKVDELPKFKSYLKRHFKDFLGRYTDSRAWRNELDVNMFAEQFFYLNGLSFVQKRLQLLNFVLP